MRVEQLLLLIDQEVAKRSVEYMTKPARRDTFEYGERCGFIQGLAHVKAMIDKQLSEEDDSGKIRR